MKKIYSLFGTAILLATLVGCTYNELCVDDLEKSAVVFDKEVDIGASLNVDTISGLDKDLVLTITNNSKFDVCFGVSFFVETEINGTWYLVPFEKDMAFIEIAIMLKSKEDYLETINLGDYYKQLPDGKYRIVKSLSYEEHNVFVFDEFFIESN